MTEAAPEVPRPPRRRLDVGGQKDAVAQVVDQYDGQVVYPLRIKGDAFRPRVFRAGTCARASVAIPAPEQHAAGLEIDLAAPADH